MELINNCASCSGVTGVQHMENCVQILKPMERKVTIKKAKESKLISHRDALHLKVYRWALSSRRKDQPLWKILGHQSEKSVVVFARDNQEEIHFRTNKYHEENEK